MGLKGALVMPQMLKAGAINSRNSQGGYTYVTALAFLVTTTLAAQVTFMPSGNVAKRALEEEIIFQGRAYRDAIKSYWEYDEPIYPRNLDDLLTDPRASEIRHLRRLYAIDNWNIVFNADGTVQGVVPRREGIPLKQGNFAVDIEEFEGAQSYAEWEFVFVAPDEGVGSN